MVVDSDPRKSPAATISFFSLLVLKSLQSIQYSFKAWKIKRSAQEGGDDEQRVLQIEHVKPV